MSDDVYKTMAVSDLCGQLGPKPSSELIESVRSYGVLSPVLVGHDKFGNVKVVDGIRRVKAAHEVGIGRIPVIMMHDYSERELAEVTLGMNNLRSENMLAESEAISKLDSYTLDMLKKTVGLTKAAATNRRKWSDLPVVIREAYDRGVLSYTAIQALVSCDNDDVVAMFTRIVDKGGKFTSGEVNAEIDRLKPRLSPEEQYDADRDKLYGDIDRLVEEMRRIYVEADRLGLDIWSIGDLIRKGRETTFTEAVERLQREQDYAEYLATSGPVDDIPIPF